MSRAAAERIRAELEKAKEGNYLGNGWYSYISREDVESVLKDYLGLVDGPLTTGADGLKTLPGDQLQKLKALGERQKTILLDLDGTVVTNAWPNLGEWIPGAREAIRAFLDAGFKVQVFSCRLHSLEADLKTPRDKAEWLIELGRVKKMFVDAGLKEVEVLAQDKPPAEFYIDDRAIEFKGNWRKIRRRVLG